MRHEEVEKIVDELTEYANLEGSEVGEACRLLIALAGYESYLGDSFYLALVGELHDQLKNFKEHATIREEEIISRQIHRVIDWS